MSESTNHDVSGDRNAQQGGAIGRTARNYLGHLKRNWSGGGKGKAIVIAEMLGIFAIIGALGGEDTPRSASANTTGIPSASQVAMYFPSNQDIRYFVTLKTPDPVFAMKSQQRRYEHAGSELIAWERYTQGKYDMDTKTFMKYTDGALWASRLFDNENRKLVGDPWTGPDRASDSRRNIHFDFSRATHAPKVEIGDVVYDDCWIWKIGDDIITVAAGYGIVREETPKHILVRDPASVGGLKNASATDYPKVPFENLELNPEQYAGQALETNATILALLDKEDHLTVLLAPHGKNGPPKIMMLIHKTNAGGHARPRFRSFVSQGFEDGDSIGVRGQLVKLNGDWFLMCSEHRKGIGDWVTN